MSFLTLLEQQIGTLRIPEENTPFQVQESANIAKMQLCLQKLRSIRATSGDSFFHSAAKVFMATCHVPFNHKTVIQASF
jgi:hypothetical protein